LSLFGTPEGGVLGVWWFYVKTGKRNSGYFSNKKLKQRAILVKEFPKNCRYFKYVNHEFGSLNNG